MKSEKVYWLFWIIAFVYLNFTMYDIAIGGTSDINIYDTYVVYETYYFPLLITVAFSLSGLGYWLIIVKLKRQLIKWLTLIHTIILIGSILSYWLIRAYETYFLSEESNNFYATRMTLLISAFLIIIVAQPIYVINLVISLFKKPYDNR